MSSPQVERRRIYPGPDQLVLRAVIVAGGLLVLVAARGAGTVPATWLQLTIAGLALLTALRPESLAGVGLTVLSAYAWGLGPESLSAYLLLAAAGLVVAHVGALLAAQGPARMRVERVQVGRWAARALALWLAAVVVWALARALVDLPQQRLTYALGLTVAVVVAVAATRAVSSRPSGRSEQR